MQLPLLITGIAGVPGYNAFQYFRSQFPGQVIGTRRVDNWPLSGEGIEACDVHDQQGMRRLFDRYQFGSVIYAEGTCKLKHCEKDPAMAWQVNVMGLENLIGQLSPGTRLVHLSIDLVFSGSGTGGHREHDPTDPVTIYGKTMVAAEQVVAKNWPQACILRISLPMGVSFSGHAGAIDWIQSRFRNHKPATLYYDEIRTPIYTDCLNELLAKMLSSNTSGIFHAGGPLALSLFQIAQIVNRVGGYDPQLLHGCLRHAAGPMPPRAGNVTMDSSKLIQEIGYSPFDVWPISPEMLPTDDRWHWDRSSGPRGSQELLSEVLYRNPRRRMAIR